MQLTITQQYMTVGAKFDIAEANNIPCFHAEEKLIALKQQIDLFSLSGELIYHIQKRYTNVFSRYDISRGEQFIGKFAGRFHFPGTRRIRLTTDKGNFYIYADWFRVKVFAVNEKWKREKEAVCRIKKNVLKVADTYYVDFEETKIAPAVAASVGLWLEMTFHGRKQ
ncbi:MAG: hypothetical protein RSC44_04295 [Clostridia bacterium]